MTNRGRGTPRKLTSRVSDPEVRLWPRLSRFYGLGFTELRQMPRVFVRVYAEEIPVLRAEEQLLALQASAYPHMDASDQRSTHRSWVRELEAERETRDMPPDPRQLAGVGIGFVLDGEEVAV